MCNQILLEQKDQNNMTLSILRITSARYFGNFIHIIITNHHSHLLRYLSSLTL